MSDIVRVRARRAGSCSILVSGLLALFTFGVTQTAVADEPVTRVEEVWELQIGTPDPAAASPQIINVISPNGNIAGVHAVFELNHSTAPNYKDGGLQLQHWEGDNGADYHHSPNSDSLATAGETVSYTLAMQVSGDKLKFEVVNGTSQTWGSFGGQGYMKFEVNTSLTDLSSYSPAASVKHSQVGFAAHQVQKFVLKQVRFYSEDGALLSTVTTESVVHEKSDESVLVTTTE